MELSFSKGDLMAALAIEPAWYKGIVKNEEIVKREEFLDLKITLTFDPQHVQLFEDERYVETTIFKFNTAGKKRVIPYIAALTGKSIKEISDSLDKGERISISLGDGSNIGKKVQFLLKNGIYQGQPQNEVETYIPYSMEAPQIA